MNTLPGGVRVGTVAHYAALASMQTGKYGKSQRHPEVITSRVTLKATVGYSRRGRLMHRVKPGSVGCATWAPGFFTRPRLVVLWRCGADASDAALGEPVSELELCRSCIFEEPKLATSPQSTLAVYFAERDGLVKIGCSSNALRRVAGLKASLLAVQRGGFGLEADLHQRFAADRVVGEWFSPSDALMAYIAELTEAAA